MAQQAVEAKTEPGAERAVEGFADRARAIESEVKSVIVGQDDIVRQTLICLIANGHALLEGVPGLGKTMLVKTISDVIDCSFNRIQFTPDLMPADIVGTNILVEENGQRQFRFQPGPVFANLLLADEINRATPKTQSALLEAMQEHQVSVARDRHKLEPPFFVLATQNPLEMEGTYPLPEAQLDRFLFKVMVEFPPLADLMEVARRTTRRLTPHASVVLKAQDVVRLMGVVRDVPIGDHVEKYSARLLLATHPLGNNGQTPPMVKQFVKYGASPRGLQAMILGGKVRALLDGRFNVSVEDIKQVAPPALRHRIILNFEGEAEEVRPDAIIGEVLEKVAVEAE